MTQEGTTRVYAGCDGVKVPLVTDRENRKRRATIKQKPQRSGRRRRALPPLRQGSDDSYKEDQEHRTVAVTSGDCEETGRLMRNVALAIKLSEADESIASVDGAPWIRNQLELHQITRHINFDYFHLKDYAQRTRREVYREESPEGRVLGGRGRDGLG